MWRRVRLQAGGRITIPKRFREAMKVKVGDELVVYLEPKGRGVYLFVEKLNRAVWREMFGEEYPQSPR